MPTFQLGRTLIENIVALRKALGSATRALSRADLALILTERHPANRSISESAVRWWEQGQGEPDVLTIHVMAQLAGVPFERFALGAEEKAVGTYTDREPTLEEIEAAQEQRRAVGDSSPVRGLSAGASGKGSAGASKRGARGGRRPRRGGSK